MTTPLDPPAADLPDEAALMRRTKTCLWVIVLGLSNFLIYAILYMFIEGEAVNGAVARDDLGRLRFFLQSDREVSRAVFLYSGIHSISIWPTVAAVMLAMLTLAKDRVISSMRSTILRGRTIITVLGTVIAFSSIVMTIWFSLQFARRLAWPRAMEAAPAPHVEPA